jgi:dynein heavy chain
MDIHMLELDTWTWNKVQNIRGPQPRARSDHCCCLTRGILVLSGGRGWAQGKTDPGFFNDIHCLDVKKMEWIMPPDHNPEDEEPKVWPTLPSNLWNHMAMAIESVPSDRLFVFGGQKAPREFSNLVSVMDCTAMEWDAKWSLAGTPPPAREDAGCAYDPASCNLIFFGGWRQKWWNDLCLLNVAGVVGPPYAVMGANPDTGPMTGGTPITLTGLRFKQSPLVSVRFTDGKREATVSGQWVSETEITCKSPDFSKFGALDVTVRVSIGGESYTVNECGFSFYANTSAKRCIAFGPGLRQGNPAGQHVSFMLQAKDIGGKLRTTGNDPIDVTITGPSQAMVEKPIVEDLQNGMYNVSYWVPSVGTYTMTLGVDENPYDDEILFSTVRGFSTELAFTGSWKGLNVSGAPAKLMGYTRFFSDGDKVYCFVKDLPKDTGFPDLPSDKALGFEVAVKKKKKKKKAAPKPEGEEGAEPAAEGEEGAEPAAEGEEGAAEEAEEEEEEEEEEEAEEPAAEEPAATAPAAEAPPEAGADDAERAPDMVYVLDPKTGVWSMSTLAESEVPEPDFAKLREAKMSALSKMGVPDKLVRAMQRPATPLEDWSIEGVSGTPPTARSGWTYEIVKDRLFVYGGFEGEGKTKAYLDDVYMLDMAAKAWTQVFRCDIDSKLGAARMHCIVPAASGAPLIVAMARGAVGNSLEVVDTLDVTPMLDANRTDFRTVMTAHVKAQLDDMSRMMMRLNADLAKGADLTAGDITKLKQVMGALKAIKDQGDNTQFTIDQLAETLAYMKVHSMGKLDPLERKLADVGESFAAACKSAPVVRKQIKPLQDAEATQVVSEITGQEEVLEQRHKKLLSEQCFKIGCGSETAYTDLNDLSKGVAECELEAERLKDLSTLFDFPEKSETMLGTVGSMRADLVKAKALWDLSFMVDSQLEEWKKVLWDDINAGALEEETKAFQKIVKGMDKSVRMWDVYLGIDGLVKNFLVSVPAVSELKSPAMRQRHWDKLMEITGATLPVNDGKFAPEFCLADLLALQLHKFVDDVGEVVDQANKEDKMEITLKKLDETWKSVEFGFDSHQGTDIMLINLAEENFEMLEENQLIVQGMMGT